MPALEALADRWKAAHTLPCGISVDSTYSHGAWAEELGGIELPLLSDFHPKGDVAKKFGLYLDDSGITDRATVLIDAGGTVRYCSSVSPAGQRDMEELVRLCEEVDAAWQGELPPFEEAEGLPAGAELFVKDRCTYSRWVRGARANLHLQGCLPCINVSDEPRALERLAGAGGKPQAPALAYDGQVLYESKDIIDFLVRRTAFRW